MRRLRSFWTILAAAVLFPAVAAAQGAARLEGQVLDLNGKPYPDVTVEIKNSSTGQSGTVKTDKDGRYQQINLLSGTYDINFKNEKDKLDFPVKYRVTADQVNTLNINFKELMAKVGGPSAEESKKREEEENKFKNMAKHFNAGNDALKDSATLRAQLKTAPADQKGPIQEKLNTDYQTAITEFKEAEEGMGPKDTKNHAAVWANLGQAYEFAGRYDEAVDAYQKSIALQPQAALYEHISTSLANAAIAKTPPDDAKLSDVNAACDKVAALDPTGTARCWKNIGIILTNKNIMKEAVVPLQKATQADPTDPQTWFLLGNALSAGITSKQEGEKMTFVIPPGTTEAYQKCIDVAPTGPYAPQAKAVLDGLTQMTGGQETSIGGKKKKK
jgi:tetratricopeptide (TPR) repeat protein